MSGAAYISIANALCVVGKTVLVSSIDLINLSFIQFETSESIYPTKTLLHLRETVISKIMM